MRTELRNVSYTASCQIYILTIPPSRHPRDYRFFVSSPLVKGLFSAVENCAPPQQTPPWAPLSPLPLWRVSSVL